MKLDILYEDENCLFINKPAGISVHGDGKTFEVTLADVLIAEYPMLADVGEPLEIKHGSGPSTFVPKPGLVHRLDKETSGVMVIAKTQTAHAFFKEQFQDHKIQKIYHAFVYGWLKEDSFEVDAPIGRDGGSIRKWTVGKNARGAMRSAHTALRVLSRFGNSSNSRVYEGKGSTEAGTFSFVEAKPQTGRTHQIRVHLKSVNHLIVCDSLYASGRPAELGFNRLALHARSLTLMIPGGETKTIEAPYPADFQNAIKVANI